MESALLWVSKKLKSQPPEIQQIAGFLVSHYQFFVLAIAFTFSVSSYWDVLPGIFQDEYIYSMESRKIPLADQAYPNYLFSFLFQVTSVCGAGFYGCAKALNTLLLAGLLGVFFLIARSFQSQQNAALLTAVAALSPLTVFASFFMPEILFYFLNLLAVWLLLKATNSNQIGWWFGFAVTLGLAMLTKRHELFLLPGYALAAFVLLRSRAAGLLKSTSWALGFALITPVLLRQVVVFTITGKPWAGLLGSTYAQSFGESISSGGGPDSGGPRPTIFDLLSQGLWHFLFHTSVVLILGLAIIRWSTLRVPKAEKFKEAKLFPPRSLSIIALSLTLSILPIVTFFESYLSLVGDSHAFRLLGRYYEFIFLLFLLISSRLLPKETFARNRKLWLWLLIPSYTVFVMLVGPFIQTGPSDSPAIHGLRLIGPLLLVFLAILIWSTFPSKSASTMGTKALALALMIPALTLATGLAAKADLKDTIGTSYSYYDLAGFYVADQYPGVMGNQVLVIGQSRAEVFATKFNIDKPGVKHSIQPAATKRISKAKLEKVRFIVVLFPSALVTKANVELVFEGQGFRVYENLIR
jgi:phosphoglycerol transferase